jgi:dienelactone hydrolase
MTPLPVYLDVNGEATFTVIHRPAGGTATGTAVVFVAPFGWEEVPAYRIIREWAIRLSAAGFGVVRPTLPGSGDSAGGPRDPERLTAWTNAVTAAARVARTETGASSVVAIGLGLGGLLAYRAAAAGAPIDGLVLWGTPARGRELTRALKAFSRLEASQVFEGVPAPPPMPDGEMEAGGFLLTAATQAEVQALDLSALTLPAGLSRGALLLERDGIGVDERVREALEGQGIAVSAGPGDGYAAMTSHPQQTQVPEQVLADVLAWLQRDAVSGAAPADDRRPVISPTAEMEIDGAAIVETPVQIPHGFGDMSGVLATPRSGARPVCLVMLNAGAIRRIGPNRMWVEAARRWAARGVPSLRLDVEAIGEADGAVSPYGEDDALYGPELVPQVLAALDHLAERGVADRFVVAGLCAGAYWSLYAGLQDPRVSAALLFNSRAVVWDTGLAASRDLRRAFSQPLTWTRLRNNITIPRIRAVLRWLLGMPARRLAARRAGGGGSDVGGGDGGRGQGSLQDQIGEVLERLRTSPVRALLLFSAAEPLEEELILTGWMPQLEQWPNVTVTRIPVRDHTLRPFLAQAQAHAALDRAMEAELALVAAAAPTASER